MMTPAGREALAIAVAMTLLATFVVFLRFLARQRTSTWWDDWICLASLVVAYSFVAATVVMVTKGHAGHNILWYDPPTITIFVQSYLATDILATACLSLTKVSILLSYRRLFAIDATFRRVSWVIGAIVFGWFVSTTCGLIFPSTPVEAEWKPWIPHTAINKKAFWVSFCSINLVLDIAVLCLPQPIVWGLKMSQRRKMQLSVVFLLGAFVCVASIVRIWVLVKLDMDNLTFSLLGVANWNAVEMTTGIICTSLPMMPPLFRGLLRREKPLSYGTTAVNSNQSDSYRRVWAKKMQETHRSSMDLELIERGTSTASVP